MPNPYPENSLWVGERYDHPENILRGALLLGESTWGPVPAEDPQWVWYYINKEAAERGDIDQTFSRVRRFNSPVHMSWVQLYNSSSALEVKAWFDQFAFTNFVDIPVSAEARGANTAEFKAAARTFLARVSIIDPAPKAALVFGVAQTEFSLPLLARLGIGPENIEIMTPHPARISNEDGVRSWQRFEAIMRRVNGR